MSRYDITPTAVVVPTDEGADDCLAAAEDTYIEEHPELAGYTLDARWTDETRETITLTVPAWSLKATS